MTVLCFVDTETTSLRRDRRAWEVGLIVRRKGEEDREHRWFIDVRDLALGEADLMSLKIGAFYRRHPQADAGAVMRDETEVRREDDAMAAVERLTRGAHLIGCVPSFDAEVLAARMRACGICPSFHYHLIDVEALALGWLHRKAADLGATDELSRRLLMPPYSSDELASALGVKISDSDRHTALGDARLARGMWDAVTGNALRQGGGGY